MASARAWSRGWVFASMLAGLLALGWMGWRPGPSVSAVLSPSLQAMHLRCLRDMAEDRCLIMGEGSMTQDRSVATLGVERVMVAGTGPVDAQAHRQLAEAGARMCDVLRQACLQGASHPVCVAGAAVFPSFQ